MKQKKRITTKELKLAGEHYQAGRLKQAESIYRKILSKNPKQPEAFYQLGLLALQSGQYQKAIKLIEKAISLQSDNPDYHYHFGLAAMALNNADMAFRAFRYTLTLKQDYAAAYNNLGVLFERINNFAGAIENYQKAVKFKADYSDAYFNLARAYNSCGNSEAAIKSYEKVIGYNPNDAAAYNNLGNLLKKRGESARAVEMYQKAIKLEPNAFKIYTNIGKTLREIGEKDRAISFYEKALSVNPEYAEAHYEMAMLTNHYEYNNGIQNLENLLNKQYLTNDQRIYLNFGLGKAFEDLKQYDIAFNYFNNGNTLKRNTFDYSIEKDRKFFTIIKQIFNKEFFHARKDFGLQNRSQIFIVGMPRSGSTLVEQILVSHPQVQGAGEITDFKQVIFKMPLAISKFSELILNFDRADVEQFGNNYLKIIEKYQKESEYVTNKLLENFIFIGMIRLIFPLAIIIHCRRDPIDTCLSCYKQLFMSGQPYAYDLQELANYYLLYRDMMTHWHSVLPGYIYDSDYESLISDQENQTRKLLEFCGLPWNKQCLKFYRTKRSVETASCLQVRQPIYNSAVKFWKHYEKHLSVLIQTLGKN